MALLVAASVGCQAQTSSDTSDGSAQTLPVLNGNQPRVQPKAQKLQLDPANPVLVCMVALLNFTGPDRADCIPDTPEGRAFLIGLFKLALEPIEEGESDPEPERWMDLLRRHWAQQRRDELT